jgi:hypothetical protein
MKTSPDDKGSDKTEKTTEIRMGREVPIIKKASSGDPAKNAQSPDKKDEVRENRSSSLV